MWRLKKGDLTCPSGKYAAQNLNRPENYEIGRHLNKATTFCTKNIADAVIGGTLWKFGRADTFVPSSFNSGPVEWGGMPDMCFILKPI